MSSRYGREEMLALYDRNAEAPEELKYFDLLYQPRGKPPVALNTYDDDTVSIAYLVFTHTQTHTQTHTDLHKLTQADNLKNILCLTYRKMPYLEIEKNYISDLFYIIKDKISLAYDYYI